MSRDACLLALPGHAPAGLRGAGAVGAGPQDKDKQTQQQRAMRGAELCAG